MLARAAAAAVVHAVIALAVLARAAFALAHRLVTAALLLFTAAAAVTPLVTANLQAKPATPAATAVADPSAMQQQVHEDRALVPEKKAKKMYVVQPPAGRHHENLWEIDQRAEDVYYELGRNDFARIVVPTRLFTSSETSFAPVSPNARPWRSKYAYV